MQQTCSAVNIKPVLMGKEYWALVKRTAEKVAKWPKWKTGERECNT